ncbi:hypothetical protein QCE73_08925 [Caballeronia sp. LZ029]|uniref:hypothetical protein n=1 Tax=Caballeronia sp. LZ029 TaxID=3038564 RepID=UPI002859190E|nr:hypothetical protein [Caballeronia sp. LZ029]MDR5743276.1 hypothetical protein [Caballeronia sp. LZ029]
MKRTTILRAKAQEAAVALQNAIAARDASLAEVSRNPSSDKAHTALNDALAAVPRANAEVEALAAALEQAQRLDDADALAEKRAACLDYAKRALEVAGKRVEVAKKLDALLARLPGIVAEFAALDTEAHSLIAAALPHDLKLPQYGNSTAINSLFDSRISKALLAPLAAAGFPTWDKISGPTSLNASQLIAWIQDGSHYSGAHPAIAMSKVKIADAVQAANEVLAREIERLQKHAGLIEGDDPEDAIPFVPIAPPQVKTVMARDPHTGEMIEQEYSIDATEVVWGAAK